MANPLNPLMALGAITVGEPRELPATRFPCLCVKSHVPKVNHTVQHRIVPGAWGGTYTKGNVVHVCPTTHSEIHRLLEAFVRADAVVPRRRGWSQYAYQLAVRGWDGRPQ